MKGHVMNPATALDLREAAAAFTECRPRLFGIAFRLLGDANEAEDVVQETWIRWQTCDRSTVRNAPAFLATATTRLALNVARSARARREVAVGAWEPELPDPSADPVLCVERAEALERAVQLILETLSPTERAAFVLRHAFDYPYEEIADVIHQTQASVRQLVCRARRHLAGGRRSEASSRDQQRLLAALVAAQAGNLAALEQLFAREAMSGGMRRRRRTTARTSGSGWEPHQAMG